MIIKVQKYILTKKKTAVEGLGTVICCMNSKRLENKEVRFLMNEKYKQNYMSEYITCLSTHCIPVTQTSFSFYSSLTALMLYDFTTKSSNQKILHISDDLAINKILDNLSSLLKFSLKTCTSLQSQDTIIQDKPTILLLGFCDFDGKLFNLMPSNSKLIIYREKNKISGINPSELVFYNKTVSGINVYNWYSSLGMYKRCEILNCIKCYIKAFYEDIKECEDCDENFEGYYGCEKWALDAEEIFKEKKNPSENELGKVIKENEMNEVGKGNLEESKDSNDNFKEEGSEEKLEKTSFIEEHSDEKRPLSEKGEGKDVKVEDVKDEEKKDEHLEKEEGRETDDKKSYDEENLGENKENISGESEKNDYPIYEEKPEDEHFNQKILEKSDKDSREPDYNIEEPEKVEEKAKEKNDDEDTSEPHKPCESHLEEHKTEKDKDEEKKDNSKSEKNPENCDESAKVDTSGLQLKEDEKKDCEDFSDKNKKNCKSSKSSSSKSSKKSSKKSSSKSSQKSSESGSEKQIDN